MVEKNTTGNLTVIILIALGIIALGFFAAKYPFSKNEKREAANNTTMLTTKIYTDTDKDGLFDWQEALWGTDIKNPDTDGDGTTDGEEVKNNRNPLVKGPRDELFDISKTSSQRNEQAPITATEELSKKLLSEFLGTDSVDLPQTFLQDLDNAGIQDIFTKRNITISDKTGDEDIKQYLNKVATLIKENFQSLETNELIVLDILLEDSPQDLEPGLAPYIDAYNKTIAELKTISVPASFADHHVELLNIFNNTISADIALIYSAEDPVRGLLGISAYLDQKNRATRLFKTIRSTLEKLNINFTKQEPGSLFMR